MQIQPLQPRRHRIPVHRTHAAREQDRPNFRNQQASCFAGGRHPVDEHDDRAAPIAEKTPRGVGQHLRELPGRVTALGLGGNLQ